MSEAVTPELDFIPEDGLAGFRLMRVEVYNWGTFHERVHTLNLDGRNTLLTGDQGSGKSTFVDAITTLLVPPGKISYNKAAGAEARERTLRSYVLGHHKTERVSSSLKGKPVGLRGLNSYSVILGVFHNAGSKETVTLAQVYWVKDPVGQPERFYVMAAKELSIAKDFSEFGSEMSQLKKKLKALGAEVESSFTEYGHYFRRKFGINNEQAMELFHQTISMKSVGSLTEFVRTHMLEPFDVGPRIEGLISHFDDLNRAHEAVRKADRQVKLLEPIVADADRHAEVAREITHLAVDREMLVPYFAGQKADLLTKRVARLTDEWDGLIQAVDRLKDAQTANREDIDGLKMAIAQNGGDRLEQLKQQKAGRVRERDERQKRANLYEGLIGNLGEKAAIQDEAGFTQQRSRLMEQRAEIETDTERLRVQEREAGLAVSREKAAHDELSQELVSLRARRSNIPGAQINIRAGLCRALNVNEDDLPFVGELLRVREDEADWEGACERLLHQFGISLVVPDEHYQGVVAYVDENNLKGRLVYYRVGSKVNPTRHQGTLTPGPDSLVRKLQIVPGTPYLAWLERQLANRFDLTCCKTQDQFRREEKAITMAGQIKKSAEHHEKDDRTALNDRSRFVLGWTNVAKIEALEKQQKAIEVKAAAHAKAYAEAQAGIRALGKRENALCGIDQYPSYATIDWGSVAHEITRIEGSIRQIEAASDRLKHLAEELAKAEDTAKDLARQLSEKDKESGTYQTKLDIAERDLAEAEKLRKGVTEKDVERLDAMRIEMLGDHRLTVESCPVKERELREKIQARLDSKGKTRAQLRDRVNKAMVEFKHEFLVETQDFDASVDAADEYRSMLDRLKTDDLPRFVATFKQLLNENTINEIAKFASHLDRERDTITEKMDSINTSLTKLDYSPGRYILLEAQPTTDPDIRDFQADLRACFEGTMTGNEDEQYSEGKFLKVKELVDRFRGREGQSEQDRAWRVRVTDVRNWFVFSARELWRQDDTEFDYYPDAGGKSGGQKEKLAYTVLAASLAYQFGLETDNAKSRTFRFVVIDEAFGKGTDESANYALTLFTHLNLQVLVVTPLQKIQVIEPFVNSVGFVHNVNGSSSKLRNLTIEEYHAMKAQGMAV